MERKLLERMVGAGVLVLALVVVAPLLLDGQADVAEDGDVPGQRNDEVRSHVFRMDGSGAASPPQAVAPPAAGPPADAEVQPVPATTASDDSADEPPRGGALTAASSPAASLSTDTPAPEPAAAPIRPAAEPAPAAPAPAGNWLVQVGTFGQRANAERLVADLRAKGFDAAVSQTARGDAALYRVRVGPAGDRAAADALRARLASAGQSGQVVRR